MAAWLVLLLGIVALAASILSAVTGVAGGVLLLSGLLLIVPATAVVPLHGAVQTVACVSRVAAFRAHVRWDIVWRFVLAVVPGSILGVLLVGWLVSIDASVIKLLIAGAILISLFAKNLRFESRPRSLRLLYGVGFAVGFFGVLAGSTGPIVTQTLLVFGVTKEAHVATKSVAQAVGHGLKLPLFGLAVGFDFGPWLLPLWVMAVAVVLGTLAGKRVLSTLSPTRFVAVARALLVLVVLHVAVTELWELAA